MAMPQDSDGSGLMSLLWAMLIYWNVYTWLEHLASLEQRNGGQRQGDQPGLSDRVGNTAQSIASLSGAVTGLNLASLFSEILRRSGVATVDEFLNDATFAYEAVVTAFDSGDRETLRVLVSPEVYDVFLDAIEEREARLEKTETVFSQIERSEIVDGLIDDTHMEVSVRFANEHFKLSRDASGQLIGGTPTAYRNVEVWRFARALSSRDRAWRVVATTPEHSVG
jgi:predicted lipid-binding transport protein (Tim44 family)